VDFEWDSAKAAANVRKHGIDFADAVGVFDDPFALSKTEPDEDEARYVGIGSDMLGRVLVVIYTTAPNGYALFPHAAQRPPSAGHTKQVYHEARVRLFQR
jgi:uncharacterized protein